MSLTSFFKGLEEKARIAAITPYKHSNNSGEVIL